MAYKIVSFTPKGNLANAIYEHCTEACSNTTFRSMRTNPQDFVRTQLTDAGYLLKAQPNGSGDRSCWEPGQAIKLSLWQENADFFTKEAEKAGLKKQEIIKLVLEVFFNLHLQT